MIRRMIMRTVQMTLEEQLVEQVDRAARTLGKTRSGFTRDALRLALRRMEEEEMERQHRHGYLALPVEAGEFDDWEDEQSWGDA
jgi:metal-responsive CopG/Arc/MetJ family transcriptional regulator